MSSILGSLGDALGGGGTEVINQSSGSGGFAALLEKLGSAGLSFGQQDAPEGESTAIDAFIQNALAPDIEPNPTPLAPPVNNLGSVSDRLLTPRAGPSPSPVLGPIQDRLFGRQQPAPSNPLILPPSGLPGLLDPFQGGGSTPTDTVGLPSILRNIGR